MTLVQGVPHGALILCILYFRAELLQMADIVTPNLKEASALLGGVPLETVADMCSAAKSIHNLGPK